MIRARYDVPTVSPGEILCDEQNSGTALGPEAQKFTIQGKLNPDDIINNVVKNWFFTDRVDYIFDGSHCSLGKRSALDQMFTERGTPLDAVLLLESDLQSIRVRIHRRRICLDCGRIISRVLDIEHTSNPCPSCGRKLAKREDDTTKVPRMRMREYGVNIEPLIECYRERGLPYPVDAVHSPGVVFCSIANIPQAQ